MSDKNKPTKKPQIAPAYYDKARRCYWICNHFNEWIPVSDGQLELHLRSMGYSKTTFDANMMNEVQLQTHAIQMKQGVDYAGPLAGYKTGFYTVCNIKVLVTCGPALIEPKRGKWPVLEQFIGGLLGPDQLPYFLGWLKTAIQSLRAQDFRPGQILALAGPAGCGKSLMQNLITQMLGGRVGKPYRYMTGQTPFNSELFAAEHLAIEDEAAETANVIRRKFGSQLKNMIVNETQSFHAKGRAAVTLACFWRLTLSVNEEPENLMVLPPMDDSIADKVMLFLCEKAKLPMPMETPEQRKEFRDTLTAELPAFLWWLEKEHRITKALKDERYGVKAFHHPALLEALDSHAPEMKLLGMIESSGLLEPLGSWSGTSEQLENYLRREMPGEAARLFTFNIACGTYLDRLKSKLPDRFEKKRENNKRIWKIQA